MTDEDRRAPSTSFWSHINPYGRFVLDMDARLRLAAVELMKNRSPGETFSGENDNEG